MSEQSWAAVATISRLRSQIQRPETTEPETDKQATPQAALGVGHTTSTAQGRQPEAKPPAHDRQAHSGGGRVEPSPKQPSRPKSQCARRAMPPGSGSPIGLPLHPNRVVTKPSPPVRRLRSEREGGYEHRATKRAHSFCSDANVAQTRPPSMCSAAAI